ncbi:EAL domain-containing protein [Halopseudomonas salegens]|uniref:Periplasmic sensor diguanylate cyclase/phosphodiesterase n=1 Tax=Halopseudomonas salegens TaxID=1434072 RepID=A0A1H2FC15_9GAMM|nr:EAL domain-containing protein [Halopseudomonas salegens]SDU04825.1 periplasmic sensor diguanylate cyclase/phosphodiesterase [Halopseudomonas salegens]
MCVPARFLAAVLMYCSLCAGLLLPAAHAQDTTVSVGVYNNPPKIMLDADGQPSGIFGELLQAIAEEENWQLIAVPCQWLACLDMLDSGDIDLMPDMAWSERRGEHYAFHQTPALRSWSQLYQSADQNIHSLLDLDGKRIAVLSGSIQQQYLQELASSFALRVEWVLVDSFVEGFDAVNAGVADVVVANQLFGDQESSQRNMEATPLVFQPARLFFVSHPDSAINQQRLGRIDHYLDQWIADKASPYHRILGRWAGGLEPQTVIPGWLLFALAVLLVMVVAVLLTSLWLRRMVALRTRKLRASEERLNTILDSVEAFIFIKDKDLRYQYANQKVCDLFGLKRKELIGRSDEDFFDAATCVKLRLNDLRVLEQGERVVDEEINRLADNTLLHTFLSVKIPLHNPDGSIYALCGISTDITEHRQIQEQLHHLAFYDPLTELPNRRLLLDRMTRALANQARTGYAGALLMIDLDNFKDINDTRSHEAGDVLLQQVAARLGTHLRATDTLARIGGDEFVLMLEDLSCDHDEAFQQVGSLANSVLQRMDKAFRIHGQDHVCSASIGIAMFADAVNHEDLLKAADMALFAAKSTGRNTARFFNTEMQAAVNQRSALEAALREALEAGRKQLQLFVQPQVDSRGKVIGKEALLRWQHPEKGAISPAEFIPVAESTGLIIPLGEWVINEACRILSAWQQLPDHRELPLAVNISPRQFRHPGFVEHLLGCLEAWQVDPGLMELEVTESLLIDDLDQTIERMCLLRDKSMRLSLDDFGTGYASLGYLKRLPLFQLKIDQSFVCDLLTDPNDAAIVQAIIALGNSLDLQVIAEGVETEEQRQRLLQLGCRYFQGYLFGRPASVEH